MSGGKTHGRWGRRLGGGDLMAKNFAGGVMIIQKNASDAPDPLPPLSARNGAILTDFILAVVF